MTKKNHLDEGLKLSDNQPPSDSPIPTAITINQITNLSPDWVLISQTNSTGDEGEIISGMFAQPRESTGETFDVPVPNKGEAPLFISTRFRIFSIYKDNDKKTLVLEPSSTNPPAPPPFFPSLAAFPNGKVSVKVYENGNPGFQSEQ